MAIFIVFILGFPANNSKKKKGRREVREMTGMKVQSRKNNNKNDTSSCGQKQFLHNSMNNPRQAVQKRNSNKKIRKYMEEH